MKPLPVEVRPAIHRPEGGLTTTEAEFCVCDTLSLENTKWPNRFRQYQNGSREDNPKVFDPFARSSVFPCYRYHPKKVLDHTSNLFF